MDEAHAKRNICAMLNAMESTEEGKELVGGMTRMLKSKLEAGEPIDPDECAVSSLAM